MNQSITFLKGLIIGYAPVERNVRLFPGYLDTFYGGSVLDRHADNFK